MLLLDFINVGYGDSILIQELQQGKTAYTLLVDCGDTDMAAHYERHRICTCDYLKKAGILHIDTLLVTHLHKDHIGGLAQVAASFPVQQIVSSYYPPSSARAPDRKTGHFRDGAQSLVDAAGIYLDAITKLEQNGTQCQLLENTVGTLNLTEELSLNYIQGWKNRSDCQRMILDALYQEDDLPDETALNALDGYINNLSIVVLLQYKGHRILLPGDVTLSFWEEHPIPENCDIVKLPHHGHRDSFDPVFFQKVNPQYVVVSVSNERTDDCPSACLPQITAGRTLLFTDAVKFTWRDSAAPRSAVRFSIGLEDKLHPPIFV